MKKILSLIMIVIVGVFCLGLRAKSIKGNLIINGFAKILGVTTLGDAATDTVKLVGLSVLGAGAGKISDVAGTMTITEDTVALSGCLKLGDVIESVTTSGDSVCAIVIGGTTYKIRP